MDRCAYKYPHNVFLKLTNDCNNFCRHCSEDSGSIQDDELTVDEWLRVANDLINHNIFEVIFTGGEPTLSPALFPMLELIAKTSCTKILNTNAMLCTESYVAQLEEHGISEVRVSLDGPNADVHDKLRGCPGSFSKVITALNIFSESSISLIVNYCLTKQNYEFALETVETLYNKQLNLNSFNLLLTEKQGRAKEGFFLSDMEIINAIKQDERIREVAEEWGINYGNAMLNWGGKRIKEVQSLKSSTPPLCATCSIGKEQIAICANGDVVPCYTMQELKCGNVRQSSIQEIYLHSKGMKRIREVSQKSAADLNSTCGSCVFNKICGAGCRARAFLAQKDIEAPDPHACMLLYV